MPAALNGGTAYTASLDGTYALSDGTVTFTLNTEAFLRDMVFTVAGNQLLAARTLAALGSFSPSDALCVSVPDLRLK